MLEKIRGITTKNYLVDVKLPLQAEKNRAAAAANNLQKGSLGPMRLYVGSLHFNITEEMLRGIFEPFGKVRSRFYYFYTTFTVIN